MDKHKPVYVATGLYRKTKKTFMNVHITDPSAPSNMSTPVDKLLLKNEAKRNPNTPVG